MAADALPMLGSGRFPELALPSWEAYLASLGAGTPSGRDGGAGADGGMFGGFGAAPGGKARPRRFSVGEHFTACPGGPELVVLPPGKFLLGAHPLDPDAGFDEKPRREIQIGRAFAIGIVPITFEQWDACVEKGGSRYSPTDSTWGRGRRPVINVSWHDAEEYLGWLKRETGLEFRLPTESEWAYACWGGEAQTHRYPWGEDYGARQLEHHAWYYANSQNRSQPVGGRQPNAWGLFDMLGNVNEWVQDHHRPDYSVHPADGSAHFTADRGAARVLRGGSWLDNARAVRPSARQRWQPDHRSYNSGFRVALTVDLEGEAP